MPDHTWSRNHRMALFCAFQAESSFFSEVNYAAFVFLHRATTMQKKSQFDVFELCRSVFDFCTDLLSKKGKRWNH